MPKALSKRVSEDVVALAQRGEAGVTIEQIAEDFAIFGACLWNWLRHAEVDAGRKPGVTSAESTESRELRKRNRLLDQENEVLRRDAAYWSQVDLLGKGSTHS